MPAPQGRYWILTIPHHLFMPFLPPTVDYIIGQLEQGEQTGYLHWQVVVHFSIKRTRSYVKNLFGDELHAELTRSSAAEQYSFKEATRVGQQFELGKLPMKRNAPKDWDLVRRQAITGDFESIPSDVYIRCYSNLKRIHVDHLQPSCQEKEVYVFWGRTGAGKSKRAWDEATFDAYPKDPNSKFWDGYKGQENVVIDEFRGAISISHMLRWLDRYPTIVEVKGSSTVLRAKRVWITSNVGPEVWYPDLDQETLDALRRRFTQVIHYN